MNYGIDEHYEAGLPHRVTDSRSGAIPVQSVDEAKATRPFLTAMYVEELNQSMRDGMFREAGMEPPPKKRPFAWKQKFASPTAIQISQEDRERLTALRLQQQTTNEERSHDTDNTN
jgi:hypothetical protein